MTDSLTYRLDGGTAVLTLDDGKANALSHALLAELNAALDRAEGEAGAVVITGREGRFCAGFDLATMTESTSAMRALVIDGARFLMRLYGSALPTVAACTGHALAAGALVLLACDHRVGGESPAKIGLNEVAIGMALPVFAVELARERLAVTHFGAATIQAHIYDPATAVEAGYLDRVVTADQVIAEAVTEAGRLGELRRGAYAGTKDVARRSVIARILGSLEADMAAVGGPTA